MSARKPWTAAELKTLKSRYPNQHTTDIAHTLGRAVASVYKKANAIGLKKSHEYLSSASCARQQNAQQNAAMRAKRFQQGNIPWNKGTNYNPGGRSKETQFKPGQMGGSANKNYKPIGSNRINRNGHLEQKITDDPTLSPKRRWVQLHYIVWEKAHGPVPRGHLITFKVGQKTTQADLITADRLECIKRKEIANRNHPRSTSPAMGALYQLKGAITRQVHRITKQAKEKTA